MQEKNLKEQWVPKVLFWGDKLRIVYPFDEVYAPKVDPMNFILKREDVRLRGQA